VGELIFNGALLLMFISMTFYGSRIEIWNGYYGARYWPMMLSIIASIIFAFKTVAIYIAMPVENRRFTLNVSVLKDKYTIRLLLSFIWVILYAVILDYGGFFITTVVFGMGMSWLLGLNNIGRMFLGSFCVTAVIYSVFAWGLRIMLPRGVGFFYYLSYWLETIV
jgi:hypothetical protein